MRPWLAMVFSIVSVPVLMVAGLINWLASIVLTLSLILMLFIGFWKMLPVTLFAMGALIVVATVRTLHGGLTNRIAG